MESCPHRFDRGGPLLVSKRANPGFAYASDFPFVAAVKILAVLIGAIGLGWARQFYDYTRRLGWRCIR
jgi:hypothetical protein